MGGEGCGEHSHLRILFRQFVSMLILKMLSSRFLWSETSPGFRLLLWSSRTFPMPWAMKMRLHWTFDPLTGEFLWTWSSGKPGDQVPRCFPLASSWKRRENSGFNERIYFAHHMKYQGCNLTVLKRISSTLSVGVAQDISAWIYCTPTQMHVDATNVVLKAKINA